jgi:hypothetical protein
MKSFLEKAFNFSGSEFLGCMWSGMLGNGPPPQSSIFAAGRLAGLAQGVGLVPLPAGGARRLPLQATFTASHTPRRCHSSSDARLTPTAAPQVGGQCSQPHQPTPHPASAAPCHGRRGEWWCWWRKTACCEWHVS